MAIYSKQTISSLKKSKTNRIILSFVCVLLLVLVNLIFEFIPSINNILFGAFGLSIYAIIGISICLLLFKLKEKKPNVTKKEITYYILFYIILLCIIHLSTSLNYINNSFSEYIKLVFYNGRQNAGGVIFGAIVYPLYSVTHIVACYVFLTIFLTIISALLVNKMYEYQEIKNINKVSKIDYTDKQIEDNFEQIEKEDKQLISDDDDDIFIDDEQDLDIESIQKENSFDNSRKNKALEILKLRKSSSMQNIKEKVTPYVESEHNETHTKTPIFYHDDESEDQSDNSVTSDVNSTDSNTSFNFTQYVKEDLEKQRLEEQEQQEQELKRQKDIKFLKDTFGKPNPNNNDIYDSNLTMNSWNKNKDEIKQSYNDYSQKIDNFNQSLDQDDDDDYQTYQSENDDYVDNDSNNNDYNDYEDYDNSDDTDDNYISNNSSNYNNSNRNNSYTNNSHNSNYNNNSTDNNQTTFDRNNAKRFDMSEKVDLQKPKFYNQVEIKDIKKEQPKPKKEVKPYKYIFPPIDLLNSVRVDVDDNDELLKQKGNDLEMIFKSFNINAKITSITQGPTFSRYEMQMPPGVPVNKINQYSNDIAMALQVADGQIRFQIPIPGKNAFGVEVPNEKRQTVGLREIIESMNFEKSTHPLTYAIGKDISGDCIVNSINQAPHMLIAGSTNSGKSVCLNAMLISLFYKASPEDVKIVLIDPKIVEFAPFKGLPHLLVPEPIFDVEKAIMSLNWAIDEMERRLQLFSLVNAKKIDVYNQSIEVKNGTYEKVPYIVYILDEFADLMNSSKRDVEDKINKLAAKSRAAGIHLVLATQRPSVEVITGTIKNNLPTRVAFKVTSQADSRTIFSESGAEKLLGRGDMIFLDEKGSKQRIQGAFVSDDELKNVLDFIKENNECRFDSDIQDQMFNPKSDNHFDNLDHHDQMFDPLLKDCIRAFIKTNNCSISRLQRMYSIGWNRAGKIVDQMEAAGYISAPDNKNNRTLFITQQEFEEKFGEDL